MKAEDIEFMEVNAADFEPIKHGYMNNIGGRIHGYAKIYQTYIDAGFNINSWCGSCAFDMMKRLKNWYDKNKPVELLAPEKTINENITVRKSFKRR